MPTGDEEVPNMPHHGDISKTILALLSESYIRLTPRDLIRKIQEIRSGVSRQAVRNAIQTLVAQSRLIYTQHFSTSHLELNFKQPVQVSERIFLSPADGRVTLKPGSVLVKLMDGIVFGGGDHPTTRLILRGMDAVLAKDPHSLSQRKMRVLDVGTGSGVLALAALKLGVGTALGIDIDPLACDAARKNAVLNCLSQRFEIDDHLPTPTAKIAFELILANLRPPTLKLLFPRLIDLSSPGVIWVLSGFRVEEQNRVEQFLPHVGEQLIWASDACDWAACVLKFPDTTPWTVTEG